MTYLNRVSVRRFHSISLPRDPLISTPSDVLCVYTEVWNSLIAVDQLTQSTRQTTVLDISVVGEVEKLDLRAATITLPHAVRYDTV